MRIAFIHSGLEPGKDGVGDYTRLLAAECVAMGHPSCIIALNDAFVTAGPFESQGDIPCLRIGQRDPWPARIERARVFLDGFKPDRISLQFVCYGWHSKGFARGIGPMLAPLIGRTRLQMLLHETWIGVERGASLKDRIVGAVQRHYVREVIQTLRPAVVHTTNPAWQALLAQIGVSAELLPLFGLIPIIAEPDFAWIYDELSAQGIALTPANRESAWVFALFGSLHPAWPTEPLFSYLRAFAEKTGRKLIIVAAGRMTTGETLWDTMTTQYAGAIAFCRLGERSPEQISAFLQFADFGIATTPWAIIGKSATVSSMLDHGLPMIVNRDELKFDFTVPEAVSSPLLHQMGSDLAEVLPMLHRVPPRSTVSESSRQMLASLI